MEGRDAAALLRPGHGHVARRPGEHASDAGVRRRLGGVHARTLRDARRERRRRALQAGRAARYASERRGRPRHRLGPGPVRGTHLPAHHGTRRDRLAYLARVFAAWRVLRRDAAQLRRRRRHVHFQARGREPDSAPPDPAGDVGALAARTNGDDGRQHRCRAVFPAARARQRRHVARVSELAVPRPRQPAHERRVAMVPEQERLRHSALLRRGKGCARTRRPGFFGLEERLGRGRALPRSEGDGVAHRSGPRKRRLEQCVHGRRGFLTMRLVLVLAALTSAVALIGGTQPSLGASPHFFDDDPLFSSPDTQDAPEARAYDIDLAADLVLNTFSHRGDGRFGIRAENVNTIDEVPDSSWFTNRIGARAISVDELMRGPNTGDGPAPGRWTVIRPKSAGFAPGFTVQDSRGEVWFITLDPKSEPNAATGAIAVAVRLFWALGYNQVESYLATVKPTDLTVGEKATIAQPGGHSRRMTMHDVQRVLARGARGPDGSYRVLAGRSVPGRVLGG